MSVEKYSHVIHLVSRVEGTLDKNNSIYDALKSVFPAGTLSGAPKIRAMQIISELEPDRRGPYGGAVGYFGYDGNLDTCITIRPHIIMNGNANDCQIAAFLTALNMKGETDAEISGFSRAMLEKAIKVKSKHKNLVDTCGTGGDGLYTFNISTTAAFVAAGAGGPIAKHGNRSVSSRSGSAEVLEELGVNIDLECGEVSDCLDHVGIGFIFAPKAHTAMKYVAKARKDMGIRTVFNRRGHVNCPG